MMISLSFSRGAFESLFESAHVVMAVFFDLAEGEATAVQGACMIAHIDNGDIVPAHKSRNCSRIGWAASCEDRGSFLLQEFRRLSSRFFVDIEVSVETP
jgi:hypothetical protein